MNCRTCKTEMIELPKRWYCPMCPKYFEKMMKDYSEIADALEYVKKLDAKIDIILCDPPFLVEKANYKQIRETTQNKLEEIEILPEAKLASVFLNAAKCLKKKGWLVFKADDYTARQLYPLLNRDYLSYSHTIVWDKQSIGLGYYSRKQHEVLEFYRIRNVKCSYYTYKPPEKSEEVTWHGDLKGDKPKCMRSVLKIPKHNLGNLVYKNQDKDTHINQTPSRLWEDILFAYCPTDGNILDPFFGTKSVFRAAKKLGFTGNYYGCDIKDWSKSEQPYFTLENVLEKYFDTCQCGKMKSKDADICEECDGDCWENTLIPTHEDDQKMVESWMKNAYGEN